MSSIIYFFVAGISTMILFVLSFVSHFFQNPKKILNPPPGKTGWPIIGESLTFMLSPKKFVLDRMAEHSSEIFTTSLAGEKIVMFCGATSNKWMFSNAGKLFSYWLPASSAAVLCHPKVNYDTPTGKPSNELFYKFLQLESIQRYVPDLDTMVQEHLATHWVSKDQVKAHVLAKEYTLSTGLRLLVNYSDPNPNVNGIGEPLMYSLAGLLTVPINLPGTPYNKALTGSKLVLEKVIDLIQQRRKNIISDRETNKDHRQQDDLSGKMIVDSLRDDGQELSDEDIATRIIGLIFAGFYPTSTTIAFTIAYLAEHPDVYQMVLKEQVEIRNSKKEGEKLSYRDVQKMQYSWNVISETMRLKPPVIGNFRTVLADFTFAGYKILKGCKASWTPYTTHSDPKYFPDPEKFDPSRFEKSAPPPFTYVPFGGGSRMCAGKDFARILILVYIHNVVTKFRFLRVCPNEKIVFNPDPIPSEGLPIYLQPHVK